MQVSSFKLPGRHPPESLSPEPFQNIWLQPGERIRETFVKILECSTCEAPAREGRTRDTLTGAGGQECSVSGLTSL